MMDRREVMWSRLAETGAWDLLVIGGGITGAAITREAARSGLRVLLVEQRDFASGASSRSSNVVHGGLRYLLQGQFAVTRAGVSGRQDLLTSAPGLVEPMPFLALDYGWGPLWRAGMGAAIVLYDLFAGYRRHRYHSDEEILMMAPGIDPEGLRGGFRYFDARTDDARLVWRMVEEATQKGAVALNYARVEELVRERDRVAGARLCDALQGRRLEVRARIVVNATGAWADLVRAGAGLDDQTRIRPLRGSHLIFPGWRLPVAQALAIYHPLDHRPVSIKPWEGCALVGTTDLDHDQPLDEEPRITPEEVAYLMSTVERLFPALKLTLDDVISTYAGVRPVAGSRTGKPSSKSREYETWEENGLVTVAGGKLTTAHQAALRIVDMLRRRLSQPVFIGKRPALDPVTRPHGKVTARLLGRYGSAAAAVIAGAPERDLERVPSTDITWAELRYSARAEMVMRLDDLLLRRTRLGLILPRGGEAILPAVRAICQEELGWDEARWHAEEARYLDLWRSSYGVPDPALIPDWHAMLEEARAAPRQKRTSSRHIPGALAACAAGLALAMGIRRMRQSRSGGSKGRGQHKA